MLDIRQERDTWRIVYKSGKGHSWAKALGGLAFFLAVLAASFLVLWRWPNLDLHLVGGIAILCYAIGLSLLLRPQVTGVTSVFDLASRQVRVTTTYEAMRDFGIVVDFDNIAALDLTEATPEAGEAIVLRRRGTRDIFLGSNRATTSDNALNADLAHRLSSLRVAAGLNAQAPPNRAAGGAR